MAKLEKNLFEIFVPKIINYINKKFVTGQCLAYCYDHGLILGWVKY